MSPQSVVLIHGGMPLGKDEIEEGSKLYAERRFNDSDTRLLLATDAASEGLNLQRYCHTLINYELPWNPNVYPRVTFERCVATADWARAEEPEFLAFGHPLLERMVHFCRVTKAAELGGQLACLVAVKDGCPTREERRIRASVYELSPFLLEGLSASHGLSSDPH